MPKKIDTAGLKHFKDKENAMVASEFSASKSYAIGEYVYYKGTLYKFKAAHAAGAWTTADVDAVKLADDVSVLKESFDSIKNLTPINKTFEQGTAAGYVGESLTRMPSGGLRNVLWKADITGMTITANDGYDFWVYYTDSTGAITDKSATWETKHTVSNNNTYDVTVVSRRTNNSAISVEESQNNTFFTQVIITKIYDMDESIAELTDRITNIDGLYTINPNDFVIGALSISTSGWTVVTSAKRVSSDINKPIHIEAGDIIKLTDYSDARFYVGYRRSDNTYGTPAQWFTRDLVAPETGDYVITISNITEVDLPSKSILLDLLRIYDKDSLEIKVNSLLGGMYSVPGSLSATQVYSETYDTTKAVQGLCSDGTYLYQAVQEQLGSDSAGTTIKKIALSDYSLVASDTGTYGHMNDMTYDGTYLLSIYQTSANYNIVTRFNPNTLAKVDDIDLSTVASAIDDNVTFIGIAFASDINRYIIATQDGYSLVGFAFLKPDWTLEKYIKVIPQNDVTQCIAYADGIIYAVIHRAGIPERIYAYDMHGNIINYTENIFGYESEGIAIVNNDFYLSYNPSNYKALYIFRAIPALVDISIAETMAKYNLNY